MAGKKGHQSGLASGAGLYWATGGVLTTAAAAAGQCPPGTFNYGPPINPTIAAIVIDHFGASGPLLPDPVHVARVERDVALIRQAYPELATIGHGTGWVPGRLLVKVPPPLGVEFVCANVYYRATLRPVGLWWWVLEFPAGTFNPYVMAAIYREIPGVQDAGLDYWACAADSCCKATVTWSYQVAAAGAWRWKVVVNDPPVYGCPLPSIRRTVLVTQDGEVQSWCYANCDGSTQPPVLNVNDFLCFQAAFAAGDPYANCDESTTMPVLNVLDFLCFQGAFAEGCR